MNLRPAKNIGIEVRHPDEGCEDDKCPFHGSVRVRGIILTGRVLKKQMKSTVVVERRYAHYVKKYKRYMRRRSRLSVHLPPCIGVEVGDVVKIAECRPLSKTVSFVVIENVGGGRGG